MINRELAKGILKEELDKRSVGMPKGVELSAYLDCMEIYLDKSFVKVLELLVNKEKKIGNGLIQNTDELNTIIFSSHLIEFAVEMADVVYFMGKPQDKEYSTIIKKFDLKEMGIAWTPYGEGHQKVVDDIKQLMDAY